MTAAPSRSGGWAVLHGPLLIYAHDLFWAALCMLGALKLRYHFEPKPFPASLAPRAALLFVLVCAVVFPLFRLHRGLWRFTAADDLLRAAQASAAATLVFVPVLFLYDRLLDFPRSTPLILAPLLAAGLCLGRVLVEAFAQGDWRAAFRFVDRDAAPAVVVGGASGAAAYLSAARRSRRGRPRIAGLVVLGGGAPIGRTLRGAEILGDLPRLAPILQAVRAAEGREPQVIVAEPRPDRALLQAVIAAAAEAGARVVTLRGDGAVQTSPVQAADLLDRPPRHLDRSAPQRLLAGRRILVTGAGGTIGGELTRQILEFAPERVILFDASEYNLYAIDRHLRDAGTRGCWSAELGDVRDERRLRSLILAERPDVVLHAAALKHVPLMELNPCEAILTNVMGAVNVAKAARGVCESLVFISTDKAVNPTNVMGATKRAAEQAVQALARAGGLRAAAVRFGNVLGSTGSVVPLFEQQIARGGPLTVTDPAMERYFMTVQEAAALVLQAAALPDDAPRDGAGRIFVLDMGEPVRIDDLARQLARLHGLEPGRDIQIVYSGLRPGEKLYEEIFYDAETVTPTGVDGVLRAVEALPAWSDLEGPLDRLAAAAAERDEARALRLLKDLVPGFRQG